MHVPKSLLCSTLLLLKLSYLGHGFPFEDSAKRQVEESSEASPASTVSISSPQRTRTTSSDAQETSDAVETSTRTQASTARGSASSTTTRTKGTFVDPRLPAGGVVLKTPITTSGSLYYKIGEPITFGWNYTSLSISPTAVNVEAFCSDNSQTYTIAHNVSIAKPTVVWDTGSYTPDNDQPPLAMGIYTLLIYDERSAVTDMPSAGKLAAFNGFKFGMYTPEPYTPLPDFNCATCETSSAASLDLVAIRMLMIFSIITSLSFVWFVGVVN